MNDPASSTVKSRVRDVAARSIVTETCVTMKTNVLSTPSNEGRAYAQLQQQIHDALRAQHPDWVEPNGDCPTCESYESRLAELLGLSLSTEHRSAA